MSICDRLKITSPLTLSACKSIETESARLLPGTVGIVRSKVSRLVISTLIILQLAWFLPFLFLLLLLSINKIISGASLIILLFIGIIIAVLAVVSIIFIIREEIEQITSEVALRILDNATKTN